MPLLPPVLTAADAQLDRLRDSARRHVTGPEGERIHWAEWGEGPPLVMLHGAYGSWQHFTRQIEDVARDYRVLIPDLPGYGRSDLPADLSVVHIGRSLAAALDELIPGAPYRLLGFSFGGAIAGRLLVEQPGRQSHTLLAAPAGIGASAAPPMQGVRARQGRALEQALRANLASIMFADPEKITDQALRIQYGCSMAARMRVERVDWGLGLSVAVPGYRGRLTGLWAERDAFTLAGETPDRPTRFRGWNPAAAVHVLPGTGHWMQYENADAFNALLRGAMRDPEGG